MLIPLFMFIHLFIWLSVWSFNGGWGEAAGPSGGQQQEEEEEEVEVECGTCATCSGLPSLAVPGPPSCSLSPETSKVLFPIPAPGLATQFTLKPVDIARLSTDHNPRWDLLYFWQFLTSPEVIAYYPPKQAAATFSDFEPMYINLLQVTLCSLWFSLKYTKQIFFYFCANYQISSFRKILRRIQGSSRRKFYICFWCPPLNLVT